MLDSIDRQIVHMLTVEPRAPFRTIAEVTGISDQTAARRYRRLAESFGLRVLGVLDGSSLGWVDWFVRLQITPGSADSVAEALARRPDTRWVNLASGGTEIVCVVETRTPEQRDALFLRGLPGSRRVVQISAHSMLHNFTPHAWLGIRRALSADQIARHAELTSRADHASPPVEGPLAVAGSFTANPGAGTGTGTGTGSGTGTGGKVSPEKSYQPPQIVVAAAAAVGGLIGGLAGALIGSGMHH